MPRARVNVGQRRGVQEEGGSSTERVLGLPERGIAASRQAVPIKSSLAAHRLIESSHVM